jgi:voltage-gated potassium channel
VNDRQRVAWGAVVVAAVIMVGTIGYMILSDLTVLAGLYQTVITITSVGFAEASGGFGPGEQAFTIGVIVFGVGAAFFTAVAALEMGIDEMVGGRRQERREERMIARLKGHAIVCGFGRVGSSVANRLTAQHVDLVIVDDNDARIEIARTLGFPVIQGDATHEDVLSAAGLERARVLIACVHSDAENLSIVLSARAREPDLYVLARASELEAERRLKLAGADRVITPPEVGAERLAALVVHPGLTEFVDIAAGGTLFEFRVEELTVGFESPLAGRSLAEARIRTETGASILAVRHQDGPATTNPPATTVIEPADTLVAMGTVEQLGALEDLI